jgi:hypothetical protein
MSLATLTILMAALGALVTLTLAVKFLRDPERGMAWATHELEHLPQVMADRYFAMTFLAIGAAFYGDLKVIAYLFAVYAFVGIYDAVIYARAGKPMIKHLASGVASIVVTITALLALNSGVNA